jgi:hypothetical protein
MIIVNQELLGKDLMTNKFKSFSRININYDIIHTLIYYEEIPKINDLILLQNLKKLYIFSSEVMHTIQHLNKEINSFLERIGILQNLQFLSVIGYFLRDTQYEINCFNNLPFNLEFLEFTLALDYKPIVLTNLPINLKEIRIDIFSEIDYNEINKNINIKMPFDCDLILTPEYSQYYRYSRSFSTSQIYKI